MFTTIIPTYQRATLLGRAIRSALAQTYPDVRVVVYDNASKDDTAAVVRAIAERDPRVEYYRHESNIGAGANWAFAVERVTTEFFSILCDDDVLLPHFYEIALREFERFPTAMMVGASAISISEDARVLFVPSAFWEREGLFEPAEGLPLMLGGNHPTITTVAFRKQLVDAIGTIDPRAETLIDLDYYIRACRAFPCALTRKSAGFFTMHDRSWSQSATTFASDFEYLAGKLADVPQLASQVRTRLDLRYFQYAITSLAQGDASAAAASARILRARGMRRHASIVVAAAWAARLLPFLPWMIRRSYALRLRLLGRTCLNRLRRLGDRAAADGYREQLRWLARMSAGGSAT